MKITLLGTGTSQGIPVIACKCPVCQSEDANDKRLRSSVLIEHEGVTVVIDAGPDFRFQMLRAKVDILHGVILTHEHKDHIVGLDDVRAFNWVHKRPMDVYGEKRVLKRVVHDFDYAFAENKYPGVPAINCHEITGEEFSVGSLTAQPIRVYHHKLPVYGFRIGSFAYITDANSIPEDELKKLDGLDVLVINGLRNEPHISHFTLSEAIGIIQHVKPKRGIITHISHQLGFHKSVSKSLPFGIELGVDGLVINL